MLLIKPSSKEGFFLGESMSCILKDGKVYYQDKFCEKDIFIDNKGMLYMADNIDVEDHEIIDVSGCFIIPGLISLFSDNRLSNGYTTFISESFNDFNWFNIKEYKKGCKEELLAYTVNTVNDEILKEISDLNSLIVINDLNLDDVNYKECPIHVKDIKMEDIALFKEYRNKGFNLSCNITVEQLLNDENYLKYINDNTIEIITGENAFRLLYTNFVKEKLLTINQLIDLLTVNIADIFGINHGIENFQKADLCVFDLNKSIKVDQKYIQGKCLMSIVNGKISYKEGI